MPHMINLLVIISLAKLCNAAFYFWDSETIRTIDILNHISEVDSPQKFEAVCKAISKEELGSMGFIGLKNIYMMAIDKKIIPFFLKPKYLKIFISTLSCAEPWSSISQGNYEPNELPMVLYSAIEEIHVPSEMFSLIGASGEVEMYNLLMACKTNDVNAFDIYSHTLTISVYNLAWQCALRRKSRDILKHLILGLIVRMNHLDLRMEAFGEGGYESAYYAHECFKKLQVFHLHSSSQLVPDVLMAISDLFLKEEFSPLPHMISLIVFILVAKSCFAAVSFSSIEAISTFKILNHIAECASPLKFEAICKVISKDELGSLESIGLINLYIAAMEHNTVPFFFAPKYLKLFINILSCAEPWSNISQGDYTPLELPLVLYSAIEENHVPSKIYSLIRASGKVKMYDLLFACKRDDVETFDQYSSELNTSVYNLVWQCALRNKGRNILKHLIIGVMFRIKQLDQRMRVFSKGYESAYYVHECFMKLKVFYLCTSMHLFTDVLLAISHTFLELSILQ